MADDGLSRARAALDRGDVLVAYDEAMSASADAPDDLEAPYLALLALSRSGAAERAALEAESLRARLDATPGVPVRLREDVAALGARIAKHRVLGSRSGIDPALVADAAARYEAIADEYGGYYACINAATLYLLSGDPQRSRTLAARARDLVRDVPATHDDDSEYWLAATEAEAALLLDDVDGARDALTRAASAAGSSLGARAATRRQLRIVCVAKGIDDGLLDELRIPGVMHYCGHMIGRPDRQQRFLPEHEAEVRAEVDAHLAEHDVGIAFGSLASGADIIVAEALLDRGGELNVILPFATDEFETISVRPGGDSWVRRFHDCLGRAASVRHSCDSAYLGDNELFAHASRIAMGHARNRGAVLEVAAEQLAVWDGRPARGPGGTAEDVETWRAAGGVTHVIPIPASGDDLDDVAKPARPAARAVRALLFADFHGFSRLHDEQYPATINDLYGPLAAVVERYGERVVWRNTWGDAVVIVFTDVAAAGLSALELQEVTLASDREGLGLPADLTLRIAVHVGPVFEIYDPFKNALGWWGREMTRAARIEPRTPEGEVYATDAFAAMLALATDSGLEPEYVGRVTTAKGFETIPMYRIRRA